MEDISVIVPTFNRALVLKKAIDSIICQTHQDFELIVVDDGSTEETKELISKYKQKINPSTMLRVDAERSRNIKYIYQKNKGPSSARNRGIRESRAKFIAFLDSDDWWTEDKLEIQLKAMQENPDYLISHTQEVWYRSGKLLNQKEKHKKFSGFIFDRCLSICAVSMSTVMVKRELLEKVGLFDESLPCCEDYDFWLRVSVKFPVLLIDKPLTLKDGGRPDQVSSIYARGMDKFRIKSIKRLLEENSLDRQQRALALSELEKKCRIYGEGCIKHGRKEEGEYYLNLNLHMSRE
ncbi:glycosyltransferase family 2 protein [Candidatus Omnitrophota bacterium]